MKETSPDKYHSDTLLEPKDQATKDKYMRIYEEYVMIHQTERQLAVKHGLSLSHISRVIKWVTFQIGEIDEDAQLQVMIEKQKMRQQEIERELQRTVETVGDMGKKIPVSALTVREKVLLWQELRKTDALISKLQGLTSDAFIDNSDRSRNVNVNMNPNFSRRKGEITVDAKVEESTD